MARQKSQHVDNPGEVGRRLKAARERKGLSQRALSFPGCTPAYISRIEAGMRIPSLQLLRELGRRLDVSADYLATGGTAGEPDHNLGDAEIALRLGDNATARKLYELALEGSTETVRARALEGLGCVALAEGRARDAVELLEQASEASGADPVERPSLAESLARAYASAGELAPALSLLQRCVERYRGDTDAVRHVRFAALLGYALTDGGDFTAAEQVVGEALTAGRDVVDPYTRARLYWSQSRLLAEQGRVEAAEVYSRRTLETLRTTEDGYAIAHAIETLAHICVELDRAEEALVLLDEGEPLIRASGTPTEVAHYNLEQARALAALGRREEAASLAMAVAGALGNGEPVAGARAYLLLAELFEELGEPARAQELYELAIEHAEAGPPSKHLIAAYRRLAELLKSQGRRDEALELLERAVARQESLGRTLV